MDLSAAQTELGERGFDYLSASRMTTMLNNAKNALEDECSWPWLETTASGTAPLTVSDLKLVLYVVDATNDVELVGRDARDVVRGDPDVSTTGSPESWWLDGTSTVRTYPVSTSAQISVRYVKYSPDLSAGTDTPLIPARYHPVWIDYAVIEAYKDSDNFDHANALLSHVRQHRLPQMIELFAARNRQNSGFQALTFSSLDW